MRRRLWLAALALLAGCVAPERQADRGIGGTGIDGTGIGSSGIGSAGSPPVLADRGIGGTGVEGVDLLGAITGFGSILIDGVEVALPPGMGAAGLRVGQVVAVAARRDGARLVAERIEARPVVVGPVEARGVDGLWRVAGQAMQPVGAVPRVGQWVAVSGFRRDDSVIAATRIDPAPAGTVRLTGLVRPGAEGVMIGGARLRGAAVVPGQVMQVEGRYAGGTLMVARVAPAGLAPFGRSDRPLLVQAFVTATAGGLELGQGVMVRRDPGLVPPNAGAIAVVELRPDGAGGAIAVSLDHGALRDGAARAAPAGGSPGFAGPPGSSAASAAPGIAPAGAPAAGHGGGSQSGGIGAGGAGLGGIGGAGAGGGGPGGGGSGGGGIGSGPGRGG